MEINDLINIKISRSLLSTEEMKKREKDILLKIYNNLEKEYQELFVEILEENELKDELKIDFDEDSLEIIKNSEIFKEDYNSMFVILINFLEKQLS